MKKKVWLAIAAAAMFIPAAAGIADISRSYTFQDAVDMVVHNDPSTERRLVPRLSTDAQMYQAQLPLSELQAAMLMQESYSQLNTDWNVELSAYRKVYDYVFAKQGLEISSRSLKQAENELEIVKKERDTGVRSDLDVLQAEIAVTNARKNYENALMGYNIAEISVQQALKLEIGVEKVHIDLPIFELLDSSEYDPVKVSAELKENHESLSIFKFLIAAYENTLESVADLGSIQMPDPTGGVNPTAALEAQLQAVQQELELLMSDPNADPSQIVQLQSLAVSLTTQIEQIRASMRPTMQMGNVSQARSDLTFYYEAELHNTKLQLEQQEQMLEMLSYTYAEQFRSLEKQLALQDQVIRDANELYEKNLVLLENGMIRPADLEALRLNVDSAEFQKRQLEKEYMTLRKQFELFLQGHLGGM